MTKKLYLFAVIAGLMAAVGFGKNTLAGGGPPVTQTFDITGAVLTNPCDPSGSSDVTVVSGTADETEHIIDLPDGTQNVHVQESIQGVGTDSNNNVYRIGGSVEVNEVHSTTEGEVEVIKVHSKTGMSFVSIINIHELRNNEVDHQKNICVGNP